MEIQDIPVELIDLIPISVSVRIDDEIVHANKMCIKLAGLDTFEEFSGFKVSESIHPDDRAFVLDAKKDDTQTSFKYRAFNLQGDLLYLESNIFKAEWGGQKANVFFTRDITEENQSQKNLEAIRDKLLALHNHISQLEESETLESVVDVTHRALSGSLGFEIIDIVQLMNDVLIDVKKEGEVYTTKLEDTGIINRAARTRQTQLIMDTLLDPDYVKGNRETQMRSELAVPVQAMGEVVYVLNIENPISGFFTDLDQKMVESMALHMSHAITRISEKQQQKQYTQRLEALHRFVVEVNNLYTIDKVAESIVDVLKSVLQYSTCAFGIVEGDFLVFRHKSNPEPVTMYSLDGAGISVRAVNTGEVQYVPDVSLDPDFIAAVNNMKSELAVPISVNGVVVAVINVESEKLDSFAPEDRELVYILAEHASSSIKRIKYVEEVERIERERSQEIIEGTSRVTRMVSHDVKGPLSVIKNSLYLFESNVDYGPKASALINDSVNQIDEIINDLGELTLTGNIVRIISDIVPLIRNTLNHITKPDNVTIAVNVEKEVIFCNFDPSKLRRVFSNLILNAYQAMPSGGELTVDISTSDNFVVLLFTDTGEGIPPSIVEKVFNPYFTTKPSGMGLGLSICKQIIEAHQGSITVESTQGKGTCFTLKLPI